VSDFDPLGDEGKLEIYYKELKEHPLLVSQYPNFVKYHQGTKDIHFILEMQNTFSDYIRKNKVDAKKLKGTINNYFKILNLIEFVIELDPKYSDALFLDYLRKYNNEYNNIYKPTDIIDDVEIYFDNKIGIVAPLDYTSKIKVRPSKVTESHAEYGSKYKYNILKVIEKRNKEEEEIAEKIKEFEMKVETFFDFLMTDRRFVAKIKSDGHFSPEEILKDFSTLYRRYMIQNKDLGEFFKRETQDNLTQLCDDFERTLKGM
jgi:type I restriction enzyme R subunit